MVKTKIDVFSEGKTEKEVITQIAKRIFTRTEFQERGGGGVSEMLKKLQQRIKDFVDLQNAGSEPLNILVLCDCDEHLHQTLETVRDEVLRFIQPSLPTASFEVVSESPNVSLLHSDNPNLHLSLHVAEKKYEASFAKATIDDLVIELGLRPATLKNILAKNKVAGLNQKPARNWDNVTEEKIVNKVCVEIPALLASNEIPALVEAKEYLRVYATILQEHISPAVIAGKILANAEEQDIREVFASLFTAIQLISA